MMIELVAASAWMMPGTVSAADCAVASPSIGSLPPPAAVCAPLPVLAIGLNAVVSAGALEPNACAEDAALPEWMPRKVAASFTASAFFR